MVEIVIAFIKVFCFMCRSLITNSESPLVLPAFKLKDLILSKEENT